MNLFFFFLHGYALIAAFILLILSVVFAVQKRPAKKILLAALLTLIASIVFFGISGCFPTEPVILEIPAV